MSYLDLPDCVRVGYTFVLCKTKKQLTTKKPIYAMLALITPFVNAPLIRNLNNNSYQATMTSPARSISSDDEESRELAELKARHEAEMRKAAERKAQKDQEHQERWEREKREREEREKREREEREAMTHRIREVGKAVAEVARGLAETDQEQEEREKEALRRMRMAELPTEAEVEAPAGNYEGGQKDEKGPGHGAPETEVDDDGDVDGAPPVPQCRNPRGGR